MRGAPLHTAYQTNTGYIPFWLSLLFSVGLLGLLVVVAYFPGAADAASLQQQRGPEIRIDEQVFTTVDDWQQGAVNGLIISNNDNGELRLDDEEFRGGFISDPFATSFAINAAGALWQAELPEGTDVQLEIRGRSTLPTGDTAGDEGWGPWRPLVAGDARVQGDENTFATPDVVAFPPDTRYLQVRATFTSDVPRSSAVLRDLTIPYLNTIEGPPSSPGLPRIPINVGPDTLTTPPDFVLRSTWSAARTSPDAERADPRGVIIHQIDATEGITRTLPFLRAVAAYQTRVLNWEEMAYHYLIDEQGTLYQGRPGGPVSLVSRLSGGGTAVHVALISDEVDEPPSEPAQETLEQLLAWLGQAYDIAPTGEHLVLQDGERVTRPNIAAHNQVVPEAPDPGEGLLELLPTIRERADSTTVRSRWYFAESNNLDYTQELSFLNIGDESTEAIIKLFPDGILEPIQRRVTVPAEDRASFSVSDFVSTTNNLSVIVEASEPLIADQTIGLPTDIDSSPGVDKLSRVWYFAEGSTKDSFETFLILFNPGDTPVNAVITYMQADGSQAEQRARIPAHQRLPINVDELLPDAEFGIQIVASQPIAAERTMRFGGDSVGLHNAPGITELSRTWYFAEGTTQAPFMMQLLLLNPNSDDVVTSVTYMTPDGTEATRRYVLPPTTRLSVDVNEFVPELGVATRVESDRPLAAERALYFEPVLDNTDEVTPTDDIVSLTPDYPPLVGTVNAGAREPAFSWRFADARTTNANQFVLLSNPSRGQARVTVEFVLSDGSTSTETILMPAGSRFTLPVHEIHPGEPAIAVVVRSTQPVVVERSLFPEDGIGAGGGTTSMGIPGP